MRDFKKFLVAHKTNFKDLLKTINQNEKGFCLVVKNNKVIGLITDGDIRRFIVKKNRINLKAYEIMNTNFVFINKSTSITLIKKLLEKNKFLPYLNLDGSLKKILFYKISKTTPLAKPYLIGNEIKYLNTCIKTNWISSQGSFIAKFENKFKKIFKTKYNLTTSSGTTALHLSMLSMDIGSGDEVLVPNITFAASINTIIHTGAKPVIVEIDKENFCIDINDMKKKITKKTKAVLLVYLYGFMPNIYEIILLAKKNNLLIIEDCAEAIGSYYKNNHAGTFGDAAAFSFFGNKTITTGEGGMLCFKKKKHFEKAKILRDHGMSKRKYFHTKVGYNYRMTNMQAAIGFAQLEKIQKIFKKKKIIANTYYKTLFKNKGIDLPKVKKNFKNIFWFFIIKVKSKNIKDRNNLINFLKVRNIETRTTFYPLNTMNIYKKYSKGNYSFSKEFFDSVICLPSWYKISLSEVMKICKNINKFFS